MVERRLFDLVGGYCEEYTAWGSEDDDLLIKLADRTAIIRAWRDAPGLRCVHAEHPRAELTPAVERNRAIFAQRRASGAEAMIRQDRAAWPVARTLPVNASLGRP